MAVDFAPRFMKAYKVEFVPRDGDIGGGAAGYEADDVGVSFYLYCFTVDVCMEKAEKERVNYKLSK